MRMKVVYIAAALAIASAGCTKANFTIFPTAERKQGVSDPRDMALEFEPDDLDGASVDP